MMGSDPHSNRPRGGPIPDVKRTSQRCPEEMEDAGETGKVVKSGDGGWERGRRRLSWRKAEEAEESIGGGNRDGR